MRISQTSWKALITFVTMANAHSWIEQLTAIASNGTFIGSPGYPRGNVLRTSPDFSDTALTHILPANGGDMQKSDMMCKDNQRTQNQTDGSPRLQTQPGSGIALRFQENGHVTLPEAQKGKPKNRGTVYVYGTTHPKEDEKFLDVHKVWNKDGTGGDKRGVLLTKQNFDDGRCYQVNGGEISKDRQAKFPHEAAQPMGDNMWCQTDVGLPSSAPSGKPYTLYWVWDWPTLPGADPSLSKGKEEVYTCCMDVDVSGSAETNTRVQASYAKDQSLNNAAIPEQFEQMFSSGGDSQDAASSAVSSSSAGPSSLPASSATLQTGPSSPTASLPANPENLPASSSSLPTSAVSVQAQYPGKPQASSNKRQGHQESSLASPSVGSTTTPAIFAAPPSSTTSSAALSSAHRFQARGPSFVTRTKPVQPSDCQQE